VLHWRQLCRLFGIGKFEYVFAGGLDIDPAQTPALLEAACDVARKLAESL
jgi:FMN-dependent NADH-azoreductase